jgi:hypothetical protein
LPGFEAGASEPLANPGSMDAARGLDFRPAKTHAKVEKFVKVHCL